MKVWLVIHKDKHVDVDVVVFATRDAAIAEAERRYRCKAASYDIASWEFDSAIEDAMSIHVIGAEVRVER